MKTKFRKTIIKYFALDYMVNLFGKTINFTRGANIIYPLMLLNIMYAFIFGYTSIFLFILLVIALFFGFIYFRIFPIKLTEYHLLDDIQLYIMSYKTGLKISKIPEPNNLWVALVNPILLIITVLIFLLC